MFSFQWSVFGFPSPLLQPAATIMSSTSSTPFVSIIVPTFRRPDVLRQTLRALLRVDYPADRHEIIVVDDGSGDGTPDVAKALQAGHPHLVYETQQNRGVATARNRGASLARGEVLIFNDDDIVVQPSLIHQHLETLAEFGDCLVNGHWEFAPDLAAALRQTPFGRYRIELEQWVKDNLAKAPLRAGRVEPEAVTACNLGLRREHFQRVGGFDEDFPFAGYEDQEFSLRAGALGYRFVYNYDLQLWHNDHRLTLRQFCERQRRGAVTTALLSLKHPGRFAKHPLARENNGLRAADSPALTLKKLAKSALSAPPALAALHALVAVLERTRPASRLLPRLYWMMCGLYIFRGFREGLRRYGGNPASPRLRSEPA